jgi:hypothetical protein
MTGAGHGGGRGLRLPPHRATTAHLAGAYPFVAEGGLGSAGVYIGRDLFGGAFTFDPWELYAAGHLTNPNILVIGHLGEGKSSLVKTLLWRSATFGRSAVVADPKGEYSALAAASGVDPVRIGPGLTARLNPLDPGPALAGAAPEELARGRQDLLATLLAASLGRGLRPVEHAAVGLALTAAVRHAPGIPTLPDVVAALLGPSDAAAAALRVTATELAAESRDAALELRRLCEGDLRGMFDGPTTVRPDFGSPLVVLDLSAVYGSAAMPLLMICATSWLHAALAIPDGRRRYVLVDEAWALLHSVSTARWLQASYKLCRQYGVANVAAIHRLSDLSAAGAEGSEQHQLALGLLADAETRVIYRQPHSEVAAARELLGLTDTEAALIPTLPRGVALWRVGGRSFVVEHRRTPAELAFTDTDARMRDSAGITGTAA